MAGKPGAGGPAAGKPGATIEARRLHGASGPLPSEFTYSVVDRPAAPAAKAGPPGEQRTRPRQRTRLRTGKLLTDRGVFLTECLIFDRSDTGGRLRLPAGTAVPDLVLFFEDQPGTLSEAEIVWRQDGDVGLRLRPAQGNPRLKALEGEMRRRFYAVKS